MANTYPITKFRFSLRWDGLENADSIGFTEVTGLDYQVDIVEYRDGMNRNLTKYKQPGLMKTSNCVCKQAVFKGNKNLYNWINGADFAVSKRDGTKYRKTVYINLLDELGEIVATWTLQNAFPVKVQFSDLKADANEVAVDMIEIAHEGIITVEYV